MDPLNISITYLHSSDIQSVGYLHVYACFYKYKINVLSACTCCVLCNTAHDIDMNQNVICHWYQVGTQVDIHMICAYIIHLYLTHTYVHVYISYCIDQ